MHPTHPTPVAETPRGFRLFMDWKLVSRCIEKYRTRTGGGKVAGSRQLLLKYSAAPTVDLSPSQCSVWLPTSKRLRILFTFSKTIRINFTKCSSYRPTIHNLSSSRKKNVTGRPTYSMRMSHSLSSGCPNSHIYQTLPVSWIELNTIIPSYGPVRTRMTRYILGPSFGILYFLPCIFAEKWFTCWV